ncbi:hypothetical protein M413DRAFT_378233 [Hebeloma cylindrosporum]|uniref:Uncharacterized protein n=1 Tax=Hebeloma cylindrosporum TaxID=76867 RepID=A0A0C2Y347_HEBCY|nr:hypothetical protein M413DRAFT_378233 [Hebeloma cylindrosporum h7]
MRQKIEECEVSPAARKLVFRTLSPLVSSLQISNPIPSERNPLKLDKTLMGFLHDHIH